MTTLYTLQLSTHKKGFGKPSVHCVPSQGMLGNLCPETRAIVKPDSDAVREALPHYYRKAFDRANNAWWFTQGEVFKPIYMTLNDSRGHRLNTLYAIPYTFNA